MSESAASKDWAAEKVGDEYVVPVGELEYENLFDAVKSANKVAYDFVLSNAINGARTPNSIKYADDVGVVLRERSGRTHSEVIHVVLNEIDVESVRFSIENHQIEEAWGELNKLYIMEKSVPFYGVSDDSLRFVKNYIGMVESEPLSQDDLDGFGELTAWMKYSRGDFVPEPDGSLRYVVQYWYILSKDRDREDGGSHYALNIKHAHARPGDPTRWVDPTCRLDRVNMADLKNSADVDFLFEPASVSEILEGHGVQLEESEVNEEDEEHEP